MNLSKDNSVADPGFFQRGAPTPEGGGCDLLFCKVFAKNCKKIKESGLLSTTILFFHSFCGPITFTEKMRGQSIKFRLLDLNRVIKDRLFVFNSNPSSHDKTLIM